MPGYVPGVQRRDIGAPSIAGVNHHTIAEGQALAGLDRHAAVLTLVGREIPDAEGIRGKQSVGPRMPVSGMPRIRGMVHDGDAYGLAVHLQ